VALERAVWAELHERAFRRLVATVHVIVLDNLKEAVLTPDIYEPALKPLSSSATAVASQALLHHCRPVATTTWPALKAALAIDAQAPDERR